MKIIFIPAVLLLLSFCVQAQNGKSIFAGKKEILYSKVLNENRTIWIYTPDMTSPIANTGKRYPVLYLLDGDAHFFSTVGIIQQLSQANGNGVLPEMIVVAIENTNRLRDLIPSATIAKTNPFIDFLSAELIPYINKHYDAAPYKLLVGHSLGGLTAIDVLASFPQLFNAYIAIDPSLWYSNEAALNNIMRQMAKKNMDGRKLYIGAANTMPKGMSLSQATTDKTFETQHIRSIFKFNEFLKTNANGLIYADKFYESERHNTLPLINEYDGLRFIFDYFFFDASENDFADSTASIAMKLKKHYVRISEEMGFKNAVPETFINYLAYDALGKKHYNKAKALFELNIYWYPQSSNTYNSYADYCLAVKDSINAIANYQKALLIKNDSNTLAKLNLLKDPKAARVTVNDLRKYAGTYTLADFQLDIALELRNGTLWAVVPGEPDEALEPISQNTFGVKGKQGYTITFKMDGERPKEFVSVQPNGTFRAIFKKN